MSRATHEFSPEVHGRAAWMALDHEGRHGSRWTAIVAISAKIVGAVRMLNEWGKNA